MSIYENLLKNLTEGIHLEALVRNPDGETKIIKDDDYSSKSDFAKDLRANEFTVLSVQDNRDLYILDHSNYKNLKQVYDRMVFLKSMLKDCSAFQKDYDEMKNLYDEAMKIKL